MILHSSGTGLPVHIHLEECYLSIYCGSLTEFNLLNQT